MVCPAMWQEKMTYYFISMPENARVKSIEIRIF